MCESVKTGDQTMTDRDKLIEFLKPRTTEYPVWLTRVLELYDEYIAAGLADDGFISKITKDPKNIDMLLEGVWEMQLASSLTRAGYQPTKKPHGPDFKIEVEGRSVWIEAIAPTKGERGSPDTVPEQSAYGVVSEWPERQLLLRYTSAIKEKMEKQLKYLKAGIIDETDPYVIAISSICLSWMGAFRGVNQLPYAVTSLFAIGPIQLTFDRESGGMTQDYAHQPLLFNKNNAPIAADQFLNPAYRHVSAVLSVDSSIVHTGLPAQGHESVMVHNPLALAPLPLGIIGARTDYDVLQKNDPWAEIWELHPHENTA
jgi:type I restriction enzyme S subunit